MASPPQTIVDLGANIGLASVYFGNLWPDAKFVAVEPDQQNAELARKNLGALKDRVTFMQCLVGGTRRSATLRSAGHGGDNEFAIAELEAQASDGDRSESPVIDVVRIPDILSRAGMDHIDLLKCDIEGSEREVFATSADWINKVRYLVIELHAGLTCEWLLDTTCRQGACFRVLSDVPHGDQLRVAWLQNAAGFDPIEDADHA